MALRCSFLLLSVLYHFKLNLFGCWIVMEQKKPFEDVTLDLFLLVFDIVNCQLMLIISFKIVNW